jgi:hypothetical protein
MLKNEIKRTDPPTKRPFLPPSNRQRHFKAVTHPAPHTAPRPDAKSNLDVLPLENVLFFFFSEPGTGPEESDVSFVLVAVTALWVRGDPTQSGRDEGSPSPPLFSVRTFFYLESLCCVKNTK